MGVCFLFPSLGSGDRTQVVGLGSKRLCPLSHLVEPFNVGFEFIFLLLLEITSTNINWTLRSGE